MPLGVRMRGLLTAAVCVLIGASGAAMAACSEGEVTLRGADHGKVRFSVDLADDPKERSQGLMFVEHMPRGAGMLFIYPEPQLLTFWMKNTLIPLDMLFIDASGTVRHIHHEAKPLDESVINGGKDLLAVLEINGGLAKALNLSEGDEIRHPAFGPNAAWPCD